MPRRITMQHRRFGKPVELPLVPAPISTASACSSEKRLRFMLWSLSWAKNELQAGLSPRGKVSGASEPHGRRTVGSDARKVQIRTHNKRLPRVAPHHNIPVSLRGRQRCRDSGNPNSGVGDPLAGDCPLPASPRVSHAIWTSPREAERTRQSLRDTNSVKSRTRFVLRVSPCVRSQSVPYMCRSVPGTLTSRGSASPTKHGKCRQPEPLPYSNDLRTRRPWS